MFFPAVFIGNFPGRSIQDTNTIVLYETFPAVKKNPLEYHGQNLFSVGFYSIFKEIDLLFTHLRGCPDKRHHMVWKWLYRFCDFFAENALTIAI